ncbi:MAG: hypothetical protein ACRD9W_26825 [Terriglobia bacterium]
MCDLISWILLVIGVLFIVLSLAGAFLEIVKEFRRSLAPKAAGGKAFAPDQLSELLSKVTNLIEAVTKLLSTIAGSPLWLVLLLAGVGLTLYSHWMSTNVCG